MRQLFSLTYYLHSSSLINILRNEMETSNRLITGKNEFSSCRFFNLSWSFLVTRDWWDVYIFNTFITTMCELSTVYFLVISKIRYCFICLIVKTMKPFTFQYTKTTSYPQCQSGTLYLNKRCYKYWNHYVVEVNKCVIFRLIDIRSTIF